MITFSLIWFAFVVIIATTAVVFRKLPEYVDDKCRVRTMGYSNVQWLVLFLLFGPVGWVLLFSLLPIYLGKSLIKRAWDYLGRYSIEITKE